MRLPILLAILTIGDEFRVSKAQGKRTPTLYWQLTGSFISIRSAKLRGNIYSLFESEDLSLYKSEIGDFSPFFMWTLIRFRTLWRFRSCKSQLFALLRAYNLSFGDLVFRRIGLRVRKTRNHAPQILSLVRDGMYVWECSSKWHYCASEICEPRLKSNHGNLSSR